MSRIVLIVLGFSLFLPLSLLARPEISVEIVSEKEIVATVAGKEVRQKVVAQAITPGETLLLTLRYRNSGDETARNVVIANPVPADTVYVVGSASEDRGELLFSIDGGKTYKKPSLLSYEVEGPDGGKIRKVASPEEYSDIRWILTEIPAGDSGEVRFRVKVK